MGKLKKFLYSKYSKYIISIILGLGLATIFGSQCKGKSCFVLRAPHSKQVEKHIWSVGDNCYKFRAKVEECNGLKKKIMR